MERSEQASEIAAVALAKAADFVAALRPLGAAGFDAVNDAIGLVADPSIDDDSRHVRSTALSGLVAVLMELDTGADD